MDPLSRRLFMKLSAYAGALAMTPKAIAAALPKPPPASKLDVIFEVKMGEHWLPFEVEAIDHDADLMVHSPFGEPYIRHVRSNPRVTIHAVKRIAAQESAEDNPWTGVDYAFDADVRLPVRFHGWYVNKGMILQSWSQGYDPHWDGVVMRLALTGYEDEFAIQEA